MIKHWVASSTTIEAMNTEISRLKIERDHWAAQHKECTRCLGEALQEVTDIAAERDAYAAAADDMAAAHKVERDKHCNCEFKGDENTVQCTLHNAWADTLREQAGFRRERDALKHHLSNLLARIHRDGGQYEAEHGLEVAYVDADTLVASTYSERDALKDAAKLALTALNRAVPKNFSQSSEQLEAITALKAVLK